MGSTVVAVFIAALLCCCEIDSFLMPDKAVIIPADAVAFIGQTIRLQCKLNQGAETGLGPSTTSDMYFEITTNRDNWTIPQGATVAGQNNITAELNINNRFTNYTTVACKDKNEQLKSTSLTVEYPVRNVTNFTGTLYYENSTIILTWSLGEYLDPSCISVVVVWNPNSPPGLKGNNCTNSSEEFCSIAWSSQGIIFIRVNVSFIRNADVSQSEIVDSVYYETSATSVHEFRPIDNLKAGPPDSLKIENLTETCVWISWKNSLYFNSNPCSNITYRIEVKADDESESRIINGQAERRNSSQVVRVCQLTPFTKYSCSVQLRAKDINPWSDRAFGRFETEEDRPLTGPPLKDTSYRVGECVDNKRDVFVYWNDPTQQSLQGHLTRFEVTSNNGSAKLLRPAFNYYTDSIDCDSSTQIRVYSVTVAGPSIVPSEIYIPKEADEFTFEKDLMFRVEEKSELGDGRSTTNVTVRWDPREGVGNIQLVVYMCAETYIPKTCFNDFETVEVTISEREIHLTEIPSTTNLFGYAVRDGRGRKRGIYWTRCVYRASIKPDKPAGVQVTAGSQANSLEVSWTWTPCNKNTKVLILRYYLLICSQLVDLCVDTKCCLNKTISDVSKTNYTAKNLEGGRPYYVYLQAESFAGLGRRSDVKVGTPSLASSETERIVGITMGTVLSVMAVGLGLFCLRRCKKSQKFFQELKNKSNMTMKLGEVERQDSFDSGAYTASDPNSSNGSRPIPPSPPVEAHSSQMSISTQSSTVSSAHGTVSSAHVASSVGEGADAGTHTNGPSQAGACPGGDVHNVRSENTNPDIRVGIASVMTPGGCLGVNEGVDTDSSNPYMRIGTTNLSSHDTHVAADNVSMNSFNDSFPLLHRHETPHFSPEIQQNAPVPEMVVFRTAQVVGQTAAKGKHKRQTAEQSTSKEDGRGQMSDQTTSRGEDNSQTTDYVLYCTDGDTDYQTEKSKPRGGSVVPLGRSLPFNYQSLPEDSSQDENTTCPSVEEIKAFNRNNSIVAHERLLSPEHQANRNSKWQNAACTSATEDRPSNNRTEWTIPGLNAQLSDFQPVPDPSSQDYIANSDVQENYAGGCYKIDDPSSEGYSDYVSHCDGVYVSHSDGDYVSHNEGHILRTPHSDSYDYDRQGDPSDEEVKTCGVREETFSQDNSSPVSFGSNLSINSSNCSLARDNVRIVDFFNNRLMNNVHSHLSTPSGDHSHVAVSEHLDGLNQDTVVEMRGNPAVQVSVNVGETSGLSNPDHQGAAVGCDPHASSAGSQNDPSDEDWCFEHNEELAGDVQSDRREQPVSSVHSSGYVPLPLNIYSSSEGSNVS